MPSRNHRNLRTIVAVVATAVSLVAVGSASTPANAAGGSVEAAPATAPSPAPTARLAGGTRVATAVAVSRQVWPGGTHQVVLARSDHPADALAGGPLAAALDAPVLLTGSQQLDADVAEEIRRLGATHVHVLGGEQAVGPGVVASLAETGVTVTRFAGGDRYATAAAIGRRVHELRRDPLAPLDVVVAEAGRGWADAVTAGAWAAATGRVLLLTDRDTLPAATDQALRELAGETAGATLVGGTSAISNDVELAVVRAVGEASTVRRLAGGDRYDTAARISAVASAETSPIDVVLASGQNWPDALVAGPAAAAAGATVLLVGRDHLPGPTGDALAVTGPAHSRGRVVAVGGNAAISDQTLRAAARAAAAPTGRQWDDGSTFSGRTDGRDVVIGPDAAVVLDDTVTVGRLVVDGLLELAPGAHLTAESVHVTGQLRAGSTLAPVGDVRITLAGVESLRSRAMQGTGGLVAAGGRITIAAPTPRPWTVLARTADAGTRQLVLEDVASGWQVGDRLLLAATGPDPSEAERLTVAAVDGDVVTVDRPLDHRHVAVREQIAGVTVVQAAEVANLTRRTVIDAGGVGGHVMAMPADHAGMHDAGAGHGAGASGLTGDAALRLTGVELDGLGQAGELGRYPTHFHMNGPTRSSRLADLSVHDTANRCTTIHGTSGVVVARLVADRGTGHCVFFEDGAETGNVVLHSLVSAQQPVLGAERLVDTDRMPAAFWIQHPANTFIGNRAVGGEGVGLWWDLPEHPTGPSATESIDNRHARLSVVEHNQAHSHSGDTDLRSGSGVVVEDYVPPRAANFDRMVLWQNDTFGAWMESDPRSALTNSVMAGNHTGVMMHGGAVHASTIVGRTANPEPRPWFEVGVGTYHHGGVVRDVTFAGFDNEGRGGESGSVAVSAKTHSNRELLHVEDVSLIDVAEPLRLWGPGMADRARHTGVVDVDGSLTGTASTYVSEPVMTAPLDGCRRGELPRADGTGQAVWSCTQTDSGTFGVSVHDRSGDEREVGSSTVASRGTSSPAITDLPFFPDPRIEVVIGTTGTYEVQPGRDLGPAVQLRANGVVPVDATVSLPWARSTAYAYVGWGRWATRVPADVVGGQVRVRLQNPEMGIDRWQQSWWVCEQRGCGQEVGAAHE